MQRVHYRSDVDEFRPSLQSTAEQSPAWMSVLASPAWIAVLASLASLAWIAVLASPAWMPVRARGHLADPSQKEVVQVACAHLPCARKRQRRVLSIGRER